MPAVPVVDKLRARETEAYRDLVGAHEIVDINLATHTVKLVRTT